jgi:hypothetical protein
MHGCFTNFRASQAELTECTTGTARDTATITLTGRAGVARQSLKRKASFHTFFHRAGSIVNDRFESGTFSSELFNGFSAFEFAVD